MKLLKQYKSLVKIYKIKKRIQQANFLLEKARK